MYTVTSEAVGSAIHLAAPDITDAEVAAVERVLRSGWITTGEECALLEQELAAALGAPHVVAMSSCTAALETSFAYLNLSRGARVGVPTWTFAATALAPYRQGCDVVLLDVDPETLNLSAASVAAALDEGLDAVVAVHIGGTPVDRAVFDLCTDRGIPVVEDSAHAFGTTDGCGPLWGRGSVASCLSFYATKNITSAEGGALVTEDERLADFAHSFRLHGMSRDAWERYRPGQPAVYDVVNPGIKANLPDILAAVARVQLRRFPDMQQRRRKLALGYRDRLEAIGGVRCIPARHDDRSSDHLMIIEVRSPAERDRLYRALADDNIGTGVHFTPLHHLTWIKQHAIVGPSGLDGAESVADRVLSLPLHPLMTEDDLDRICERLADALNG